MEHKTWWIGGAAALALALGVAWAFAPRPVEVELATVRLAQELGLGTLTNPNGLPYARVGDVVTVLENLTSNALDVTMHTNPAFNCDTVMTPVSLRET